MASKKEEGSATSSTTVEYSKEKSKSLVVTPAAGGRVVDVSDGVDENDDQEEDNDMNLNGDTEGWDGNVSGEEDDSSESDTYEVQVMDSIEGEIEGDVAGEEDKSDTCKGKDNIEDEGTAGDDGYEANEEAE